VGILIEVDDREEVRGHAGLVARPDVKELGLLVLVLLVVFFAGRDRDEAQQRSATAPARDVLSPRVLRFRFRIIPASFWFGESRLKSRQPFRRRRPRGCQTGTRTCSIGVSSKSD